MKPIKHITANKILITTFILVSLYLYVIGLPENFALVHNGTIDTYKYSPTDAKYYYFDSDTVKVYYKSTIFRVLSLLCKENPVYATLIGFNCSVILYGIFKYIHTSYTMRKDSKSAYVMAKEYHESATLKLTRLYKISKEFNIDEKYFNRP